MAGVRLPLSAAYDDINTDQRTRRASLRASSELGRSAQWTLVLASVIGVMLAIGLCVAVLRQLSPQAARSRVAAGSSPPDPSASEPAVLR